MAKKPTKKQIAAMEQAARNRSLFVSSISVHAMCLELSSEHGWIPSHLREELARAAAIVKQVVNELRGV